MPTSSELYASARQYDAEAQRLEEASALGAGFLHRLSEIGNFVLRTWTDEHTEDVWTSAAATESRDALGRLWARLYSVAGDLTDERDVWSIRAGNLREDATILRRSARWAAEAEEQERLQAARSDEASAGDAGDHVAAGATAAGRWS